MLSSISPLDGRYDAQLNELRPYLSEFGLIKHRIKIEILWFISLSENKKIKEVPGFSKTTINALKMVAESFSEKQAAEVKKIEQTTNHDVKAIEYWLKETFKKNKDLKPYLEFFHFACTSEDINNLSYALMVKSSTQDVILTKLEALVEQYQHCRPKSMRMLPCSPEPMGNLQARRRWEKNLQMWLRV